MLHRLEKEVRFTRSKGKRSSLSAIREHYLREDISCKVDCCRICDRQLQPRSSLNGTLDSKLLHYAIPDAAALCKYLEVFEHRSIEGCIFLQTALNHIRTKGGRAAYRRVKSLLGSHDKNLVMFSNEYYYETYSPREKGEALLAWQERLVYLAATWYVNHLHHCNLDPLIVLLTPNPQHYSMYEKVSGLVIQTPEGYLKACWPQLVDLLPLLQSIQESLELNKSVSDAEQYTKHLAIDSTKEGIKKGLYKSGRLYVSDYHPQDEASVSGQHIDISDSEDEIIDIFIFGKMHRNRAIHGDLVAVKILPREQWYSRRNTLPPKEGEEKIDANTSANNQVVCSGTIVKILERSIRPYVASFEESYQPLQSKKSEKVLVVPYNRKIPKIRISTRQAEDLHNHRILVQIDSWPADSHYPNGHFIRSIGPIGNLETETQVILLENELSSAPFSKAVLSELPDPRQWKVEENEVGKRRDLRQSHLILSIDPKGCEDVDDTLSIRGLKHGQVELGVHIADVAHFVRAGSLTDQEAAQRSTTIYLADRRHDMLPATLSANLCSLLSNVDRYAVSVLWTLDERYEVKKVWFGRTIIRSRYKLTYETAQDLFDGATYDDVIEDIPELKDLESSLSEKEKENRIQGLREAIKSIVHITRVLRKNRGGLELEGVEVRVAMDDKDKTKVDALLPKQPLEMHEVIAECMIFANHWVAKKIQEHFPTNALLRHHPAPPPERLARVVECAKKRHIDVCAGSSKSLAKSLNDAVDENDPEFNKVLKVLATHAMVPAHYFSTGSLHKDEYHHYGLDLDLYTHFTSPIRRYADLVVHRLLLAAVKDPSADELCLPTNKKLQELCDHMNKKHRASQLAQASSTDLFQGLYFASTMSSSGSSDSDDPYQPEDDRHVVMAVVTGVRANGVVIFNTVYGIRGPVYLKDKNGLVAQYDQSGKVVFDSGSLELVPGDSVKVTCASGDNYVISMFDHVRLHVTGRASHAHGYSLSLRLLSCGPVAPNVDRGPVAKGNKELMKVVREEETSHSSASSAHEGVAMYRQSDSSTSLYSIIQKMNKLALQPLS